MKMDPTMSSRAETDIVDRLTALIDYSAEDFMLKPFKPKELLARVHLHMQLGKRRAFLETQFAQREKEIAVLSDLCPSGIVRADPQGELVYANAAYRKLCGMSDDEDILCSEFLDDDWTGDDAAGTCFAARACFSADDRLKEDCEEVLAEAAGISGTPKNFFTPGILSTENNNT